MRYSDAALYISPRDRADGRHGFELEHTARLRPRDLATALTPTLAPALAVRRAPLRKHRALEVLPGPETAEKGS